MKAPPLTLSFAAAQATLIGRDEDNVNQRTRPHMLIGLGRRGLAKRKHWDGWKVWVSNRRGGVGAELDLQEGLLLHPLPFSSEVRFTEVSSTHRDSHSPAKRDTEVAPYGFLFCTLSATVLSPSHPSWVLSEDPRLLGKQQKLTEYKNIQE